MIAYTDMIMSLFTKVNAHKSEERRETRKVELFTKSVERKKVWSRNSSVE